MTVCYVSVHKIEKVCFTLMARNQLTQWSSASALDQIAVEDRVKSRDDRMIRVWQGSPTPHAMAETDRDAILSWLVE
jgi:hypothetical protein